MAVPPAGRHTYKTYHQKLEEYRLGDPGAKLRSNAELNMVSAQNPSNSSSILEKNSDADYHRPRQLGKDAAQSVEKRSNKLISHWEKKADEHQKKQLTNPFSGYGGDTYIPKYNKNSENYGRPAEGSQTAQRGKRAAKHISFEIFELCLIIARRGKKQPDGSIVITFGALFEIYINISNKVVGMLMRARRQKLLTFETEMLYQGRDEGVLITLFKIPKEEEILV